MAVPPRKAGDLHGNVPDSASAVLMLVDVINDLNFPGNVSALSEARIQEGSFAIGFRGGGR